MQITFYSAPRVKSFMEESRATTTANAEIEKQTSLDGRIMTREAHPSLILAGGSELQK